jgi:hypothetical protein
MKYGDGEKYSIGGERVSYVLEFTKTDAKM